MIDQAQFTLRGRNPDVLTCIANLSNDEVFTPPEFANRMLDTLAESWASSNNGADLWADKSVTFLDPCTKSGVFLREITNRLNKGLAEEIPSAHSAERTRKHLIGAENLNPTPILLFTLTTSRLGSPSSLEILCNLTSSLETHPIS